MAAGSGPASTTARSSDMKWALLRVLFIVISVGVLFYVILPLLLHIGIGGRPLDTYQEPNIEIEHDDNK